MIMFFPFMNSSYMRVTQHQIKKSLPEDAGKDLNWTYELPSCRLSKALLNWQVEQLSDEYYKMVNVSSDDPKLILKAFGLDLPLKLFTCGDLRSLKSKISVF